jgi:hypothetical protein
MTSQSAIFVDAGFLLAVGGQHAVGTSLRSASKVNYERLVEGIVDCAREQCGLDNLRVYWYDASRDSLFTDQHKRIGLISGVKVRLGRISFGGEQKGVDLKLALDLVGLARSRAVSVIFLVSGDDDLAEAVEVAQDLGVKVVLIGLDKPESRLGLASVAEHLALRVDSIATLPPELIEATFTRSIAAVARPAATTAEAALTGTATANAANDANAAPAAPSSGAVPAGTTAEPPAATTAGQPAGTRERAAAARPKPAPVPGPVPAPMPGPASVTARGSGPAPGQTPGPAPGVVQQPAARAVPVPHPFPRAVPVPGQVPSPAPSPATAAMPLVPEPMRTPASQLVYSTGHEGAGPAAANGAGADLDLMGEAADVGARVATNWYAHATQGELVELQSDRPLLPPEIDRVLLKDCAQRIGEWKTDLQGVRRAVRAAFWEQLDKLT